MGKTKRNKKKIKKCIKKLAALLGKKEKKTKDVTPIKDRVAKLQLQEEKLKEKTRHGFKVGDFVTVSLKKKGKLDGWVEWVQDACNGYAVYLVDERRHVFVAQSKLSHKQGEPYFIPNTSQPLRRENCVFFTDDDRYRQGEVVVRFPNTKEFLVYLIDADKTDCTGYVIAKADKLGNVPMIDDYLFLGKEISFKRNDKPEFYSGKVVGRYRNDALIGDACNDTIGLKPHCVYEKIKSWEK